MPAADRSFGAGGYADTPIAEILPVRLPRQGRHVDDGEFSPVVVAEATHHPVVELAPRAHDNAAAWKALAPLAGTDLVAGLREGAHALLVHPTLTGERGEPMPVLAVGTPGRGRALALTTDSGYRWGMPTAGRTGDASAYERFWDRSLRWLSRDPLLDPAQISTDRESYGPAAKLRGDCAARRAVPRARAREFGWCAERSRRDRARSSGRDRLGWARNERLAVPERAGAYTLAVKVEGASDWLAEQGFVVETGGDELADPRARPDWMREIARVTSGEAHGARDALRIDTLPSTRTRVIGSDVYSPFASPWYFLVVVVLLGVEWFARRRFGLR